MAGPTWTSDDQPKTSALRGADWLRVAFRGAAIGVVILAGLLLLLTLRLVERPLSGQKRPCCRLPDGASHPRDRLLEPRTTHGPARSGRR